MVSETKPAALIRFAEVLSREWPTEHHKRCDVHAAKPCDCYMRFYEERRTALAELVSRAAHAGEIEDLYEASCTAHGQTLARLEADEREQR